VAIQTELAFSILGTTVLRNLLSVVLASASPRRFELLTSLGLDVRVVPSDVPEGDRPGYGPRELAALHAGRKADAVSARGEPGLIVAADTVVDLDGKALGKPESPAQAAEMLRALAGREHLVHTAYALRERETGIADAGSRTTRVRFAPLDEPALERYVATGDSLDKAGGYGIQGRGAALVERIDGDFYTVMGFPLGDFVRRLPDLGYTLPGGLEARA
jgi:septum formation protein